jgi:ATP-binding cassette subfamily B protein
MATGMAFVTFMDGVLMMGTILIVLVALYPKLTFFTILPLPLITLVVLFLMPVAMRGSAKIQKGFGKLSDRAQESMAGISTVKAFTKEKYFLELFANQNDEYVRDNLKVAYLWGLFGPVVGLLSGVTNLILLFVGGRNVLEGTMSIGDYMAYLSYLGMLIWPMMGLGYMVNLLQRGASAMERISEVLDQPCPIVSGKADTGKNDSGLEIRNLSFSWPGTQTAALKDISLSVPVGGSLGIVGPTGGGKSALVGLILRLYDPPAGTIFLGGTDIRDWDLKKLRSRIAIAPQEAFLFSDTLSGNIGLGRPGADQNQILQAAQAGALSSDLTMFSYGLETIVGERGITLSGGQKQRTAIARALLKDAPIMILDDSLSAVDTHTARTLLETLRDEEKKRSLIIVSHRLSAVMGLDRIAVIDKGAIVAEGTHDQLMEHDGYYRDVFLLQQNQEESDGR